MRLVRTTDLETIVRLNDRLFPSHTEESLGTDLQACTWWLVKGQGVVSGFCGTRPLITLPGAWYLSRAGVIPESRGQGLQRRMIRCRERWARSQGATRMITYTMVYNWPSNNNLIACGYRLYRPATPWIEGEALYWSRDLIKPERAMGPRTLAKRS